MRPLAVLLGLTLIGLVTHDVLTTTVSVGSGAGAFTRRVADGLWRTARWLWSDNHVALRRVGVSVMLVSVLAWLLLTWAGWTLVFFGSEQAVVDSASGQPAGVGERVYFVGYTLLTLGNGDFRPLGTVWRIATVLTVANGFLLITLAITYLIPLASAATEKRQMGALLASLGTSPQRMLTGGFDGNGFAALGHDLSQLPQHLFLHEQRHHTYPVLHYFHSAEATTSAPLRLAVLDEALTLLEAGVDEDVVRPESTIGVLRAALTAYLDTVADIYVAPADEPPPRPRLDALRDAGIPTLDDGTFCRRMDGYGQRRRLLRGLVEHHAWSWSDVYGDHHG